MKANIELRQPRDFGEIISDSIVFIKQNWKSLLKSYAVFCGFFVVANIIFSILLQVKVVSLHKDTYNGGIVSPTATVLSMEYLFLILCVFLNVIAVTLTTLCYITLYNEKKGIPPTIDEVWAYFKYYFLRATGSMLLLFVLFIVAFIICAIPVGIIAAVAHSTLAGTIVALLCIFIPGTYFVIVLTLFYPIMIMENGGFWYSFGKSFKLIKGRWWRTFGVFFVIAIIVYASFILITMPFSLISGGSITFLAYNVSFPLIIAYSVVSSLIQIINVLPLTSAAVTYFSYVEEKEKTGLFERVNDIELGLDDADTIIDEY